MRNLEQGPVLHPTVGIACFVVPNKEHWYSEQAAFVCALYFVSATLIPGVVGS